MATTVVDDEMVNEFASTHLPWRLDVRRGAGLLHATKAFGDSWAVSSGLGGMVGQRGPRELRRTEGEFLAVLLVRSGREVFTQQEKKAVVNAGSALVWDGVLPAECYSEGLLDKSTFFFPRDLARQVLPRFDAIVGKPLIATPSLKLLHSWIETSMSADYLDDAAAVTAGRVAVDLLTSAIGAASNIILDTRAIRLMEIRSYIDDHYGDPGLGIEDIAVANAISTRYLHRLFEDSDETCRQYLTRRRLEVAYRILTSNQDASITSIALRCGFATPSTFSRAFRSTFGFSPKDAWVQAMP